MSEEPRLPSPSEGEKSPHSVEPAFDAASQSLTNALRLSFRVLTFVMFVLVVLFISRGFFAVQPDQKVIIERFGKCDASLVKDQGWHYAMPYPIDNVIPVWVRVKTMDVNVFWPRISEAAKEAAATTGVIDEEVFPDAEDGVVLTGDMNAMQGRLQVTYSIRGGSDANPDDVVKYYLGVGNEANEERLIKGLVQNAFIVTLSGKAVGDVYPIQTEESNETIRARLQLSETIQTRVQNMIQALDVGLDVQRLTIVTIRPPEKVKKAFDGVSSAYQRAKTAMQEAERTRDKMLIEASGEVGIELGQAIEQRWVAYEKSDAAAVSAADEKISSLLSANPKGDVAGIIAEAQTYRTTVVSEASADSDNILKLMADDSAAGAASLRVYLEDMRVEAIEETLKNAYEKFIFNPNQQEQTTLELWLNRRTEIRRKETTIEPSN